MVGSEGGYDAIWLDQRTASSRAAAAGSSRFPADGRPTVPALRAIEIRWREKQSAEIASRLGKQAPGLVVIKNGDLFDSENRHDSTAHDRGDLGRPDPDASVPPIPSRFRRMRGCSTPPGKTIIPGLWDMHTHAFLSAEQAGLMHLAAGVTTVRDVAADLDVALSQRERAARTARCSGRG